MERRSGPTSPVPSGITLPLDSVPKYTPLMAMEYVVQRLDG